MNKRTDELVLGDLVRLPGGLIRTVDVVKDSGYVNYRNEPIFAVMYCEGRTAEWSEGNSSIARGRDNPDPGEPCGKCDCFTFRPTFYRKGD